MFNFTSPLVGSREHLGFLSLLYLGQGSISIHFVDVILYSSPWPTFRQGCMFNIHQSTSCHVWVMGAARVPFFPNDWVLGTSSVHFSSDFVLGGSFCPSLRPFGLNELQAFVWSSGVVYLPCLILI